jgi:hypothetical protein
MSVFEQFLRDNPKMADEPYGAAIAETLGQAFRVLQTALRARDLAPTDSGTPFAVTRGLLGDVSGGPRSRRGRKSRRDQSLRPDCVRASRAVRGVYRSLGRRGRDGGKGPQAGWALR